MESLKLSDGRKLAYDVYGDPSGKPVIFNHGYSDSALLRNPDESLVKALGVKVIAANQPGVGESSPLPGRKIADWGDDMEELANHLGLKRFAVVGHSAGGPHALAIAHRLPERVTTVVLASPILPFERPGATKLIRNSDLKWIIRLRRFHWLLKAGYRYGAKSTLKNIPKFLHRTAKTDPSDAKIFLDPVNRAMFEESFKAGFAQDGEGLYELTLAFWNWGFDVAAIRQPVTVFYGDADDIIDPRMSQTRADSLPNATVRVWSGAGHYSLLETEHWRDVFKAARPRRF
jgi:pimeloyl-ACP methyl ester carboxylesterase